MNRYHYTIGLRVRHPSLDPSAITAALGIEPDRSWRGGEARTGRSGRLLEGTNAESLWVATLSEARWPGTELPIAVKKLAEGLAPHRDLFGSIRAGGGTVTFFVGWFLDGQSGAVFDCSLLAQLTELKIDLWFDVYPPDPAKAADETD